MSHPKSHSFEYKGYLPAIARAGTSRFPRMVARYLAITALLVVLGVWFLPWQQFASATGKVIAFDPLDRRINVEAPVSGNVRKLHVVEGQTVKKGAIIAEIEDNDPNLLVNLGAQEDALKVRKAAAAQRVDDFESQIRQQEQAKGQAIDAAVQRVAAEKITAEIAVLNLNRITDLKKSGLVSTREFEIARQLQESSDANWKAAEANLKRTSNDFDSTISGTRAQKGTAQAEVATAERDIRALQVQISQNMRQVIDSPRDGIVLSVQATDGTYLRPGSLICVIIPETDSRFVEMFLDGNDMPLITPRTINSQGVEQPGSDVRIQFEGWPAIQFIGWPSVAVGTFGAEVVFIDPADNGMGKFRVVVAPKPDILTKNGVEKAENWPSNRFLRQGVRANGWVLLNRVPLWMEIWRQINGFPPVISNSEPTKK
jgi:membrane fusion protein, adhesin transport system